MSPRSKEQYEAMRKQSRDLIKSVALELFAGNGYQHTSIRQIAEAADISKGLIYNYFPSKEALLHAIILEAVEREEQIIDNFLHSELAARAQLRGIIETNFTMVESDLKYWKLLLSLAFQTDVLRGLKPLLQRKRDTILRQAVALFERLGYPHPELEAYYFGAKLDGILLHFMTSVDAMDEPYPLTEMKRRLLEEYGLGIAE